jgi:hypothetical protein
MSILMCNNFWTRNKNGHSSIEFVFSTIMETSIGVKIDNLIHYVVDIKAQMIKQLLKFYIQFF